MDRRDGKDLAQLLQELGKLEGLRWIRLLCEWAPGRRAGPVVPRVILHALAAHHSATPITVPRAVPCPLCRLLPLLLF